MACFVRNKKTNSRFPADSRSVFCIFLIPLLASAIASPLYSQATPSESTPKNSAPQKRQKPATPAAEKAQPAAPATPEEVRQAQIAADTKKLYDLSLELRTEVAKTYKESLSIAVLKKAEEVEKLAKALRIEMNIEASASAHKP